MIRTSNIRNCAWCGKDLSLASNVTYLNGNQPVCDLCLLMAHNIINAKLLEALKAGYPFVKAHVGALHMMDGFNQQERKEDKLLLKIEQAIAEAEGQS